MCVFFLNVRDCWAIFSKIEVENTPPLNWWILWTAKSVANERCRGKKINHLKNLRVWKVSVIAGWKWPWEKWMNVRFWCWWVKCFFFDKKGHMNENIKNINDEKWPKNAKMEIWLRMREWDDTQRQKERYRDWWVYQWEWNTHKTLGWKTCQQEGNMRYINL